MSYCYGPGSKGYITNLKGIQKLIPEIYIYFKCLLDRKIKFFSPSDDKLYIYSEKGLLKQLELFKRFKGKFQYIKTKNFGYIFILKNNAKDFILLKYLFSKKIRLDLMTYFEKILAGFPKNTIKNIKQYRFINKSSIKIPSKMNPKKEFEYKRDKLIHSKQLAEFKQNFETDYKKAIDIIEKYEKDNKFKKYYTKETKKFKIKSFEKEIKEVKKSIFFTCKVATKYKKLFPNY